MMRLDICDMSEKQRIYLQVRGAWDFYYSNHLGKGTDDLPARKGDTLLHMACRFERTVECVHRRASERARARARQRVGRRRRLRGRCVTIVAGKVSGGDPVLVVTRRACRRLCVPT